MNVMLYIPSLALGLLYKKLLFGFFYIAAHAIVSIYSDLYYYIAIRNVPHLCSHVEKYQENLITPSTWDNVVLFQLLREASS